MASYKITNLKELRLDLMLTQTELYEKAFKKFTVWCKNVISWYENWGNITSTYFKQLRTFIQRRWWFVQYKINTKTNEEKKK